MEACQYQIQRRPMLSKRPYAAFGKPCNLIEDAILQIESDMERYIGYEWKIHKLVKK